MVVQAQSIPGLNISKHISIPLVLTYHVHIPLLILLFSLIYMTNMSLYHPNVSLGGMW